MNAEKWQKVKSILEEALATAPAARAEYLEKACAGDDGLRREVESLLHFDNTKAGVFEQNAFSVVMQTDENGAAKNFIGRQIGNYKITGELGAGGMGAVYLTERSDGAFEQKAALKLIKRGMDSDAILRRFFNERQILASLRHPNIAQLLDGGTTDDGVPYFVLEYVEGETITDFAERENLGIEERLKIFRQICAAVSFAHSNLVIHRDLKPSNILVNKDGDAKLLDFGIAKLLKSDADSAITATQNFVFTPEYASPEQVRGERVTTATDVYSLGVILYELLTGNRPYKTDGKNISDIIRAVCETQPGRPSSVVSHSMQFENGKDTNKNKQQTTEKEKKTNPKSKIQNPKSLKGDLDNIILKALRKEPERRYSSVEQFAEDIRRHQIGLPVTASADTWKYRAAKFAHRNRVTVAAAALIFLTLIGGLGATLYQTNVARRERAKAEQRLNDVRKLANSFMFEINDEITKSPIKAREKLVQTALEYLDKLTTESEDNPELQSELAAAYEKIGQVQAELFKPSLGKSSDALRSHQKSLEIREKLFSAVPNDINRGLDVVKSRVFVGDIFSMSGRVGEAHRNYQESVEFCRHLLTLDAKNAAVKRNLAKSFGRVGQSILRSGSLGEALANYEEALKIYQNLAVEDPNDAEKHLRATGYILSYIGYVKIEMNRTAEAVRYFSDALAIEEKYVDANNLQTQKDFVSPLLWLGVAHSENGDWEKSYFYIQKALDIQKRMFETDKSNFSEQNSLADCYLELGRDAVRAKKLDEAIKNLNTAIENYEAVWQTDRQNFSARRQIVFSQIWLGKVFLQKNDLQKASEIYAKSLEITKELTAADANNTEWQHDLAVIHLKLGVIAVSRNDKPTALKSLETAIPILEKLSAELPDYAKRRGDLETAKNLLLKIS